MRVVFLLHAPFGRQGSASSYYLSEEVAQAKDAVVISPPFVDVGMTPPVATQRFVTVHWLHGKGFWSRVVEAVRVIDKFNPDIIHSVYGPKMAPFLLACRVLSKCSAKWVLDIRAPLVTNGVKLVLAKAIGWTTQLFFHHAFTTAESTFSSAFPASRIPVEILPIGIRYQAIAWNKISWPSSKRRFVYIGSLDRIRRLEVLVRGFVKALEQRMDGITLDIYGIGDGQEELEKIARPYSYAIRFHGSVKQEDLWQVLPSYDVGIGYVPNGPYDKSPSLKVLEYAAAGLIITASNTTAHRALTAEGVRVEFFDNTVESIASAIQNIAASDISIDELEGNRKVAAVYDWKELAHNILLPRYRLLLEEIGKSHLSSKIRMS